jgi:hypothetical protein
MYDMTRGSTKMVYTGECLSDFNFELVSRKRIIRFRRRIIRFGWRMGSY